jgi:hypothetical protein
MPQGYPDTYFLVKIKNQYNIFFDFTLNKGYYMNKHRFYNLWLHSDDKLSNLAGIKIKERLTIHEWPLSCVQKVTCEDGRKLIYKSQYGPTVEPEFYQKAKSSILPNAQTLWQENQHSCMLFDYIDAPLAQTLVLTDDQTLKMSYEVTELIGQISGDPPVFLDISTEDKFTALITKTISSLRGYVESGFFKVVTPEMIKSIEEYLHSTSVSSVYHREIGLIHGDTNGGNVFRVPGGYRVIDWQRPKIGPREIDNVAFLYSRRIDPLKYLKSDIVNMFYILDVWWLEQCQTIWIKEGNYDNWIADFLKRIKETINSD